MLTSSLDVRIIISVGVLLETSIGNAQPDFCLMTKSLHATGPMQLHV